MNYEKQALLSEADALTQSARLAGFQWVGLGTYRKYNALTGIRTTVQFTGTGDKRSMHVKHETELNRQAEILDLNVAQQNSFSGYKGKELVQGTRIPLLEHRKIMQQCGYQPGHGYDEKKFKAIINSNEYSKFRTVPGKI
jgi:hypothetical protein